MKRRIIAVFLSVLLLFQLCPASAYASLFDNSTEYNSEIISSFKEMGADEATAEKMYSMMQKYGLLDEDGNAIEKWSVTMDGREVTIDDIRQILSGEYDPDKVITVDGENVTLEKIAQIIEIEDFISVYQDAYLYGSEWTEEHEKTYASLVKQLQTEGFNITNLEDEDLTGDFSFFYHSARVLADVKSTESSAEITVTLTGANEGQKISFDYQIFSSSAELSADSSKESISLTADENGNASTVITVSISNSISNNVYSSAGTVAFVLLYNLKNALFYNNEKSSYLITLNSGSNFNNFINKLAFDTFYANCPPALFIRKSGNDEKISMLSGNLDCFSAFTDLSPVETLKKYGNY
ncbi:MAG: hypothetical protein MJ177_11135, partial [Clostridia bacterium]|nr:hypothetical protein [Clostridia bacterium]